MLPLRVVLLLSTPFLQLIACIPQDRNMRVLKMTTGNGLLERTVFLPPDTTESSFPEEDDGYVLISDSSQNKFREPGLNGLDTRRKVIKRRRKKKKPMDVANRTTSLSTNRTLSTSVASPKDPKFLNLFTIIKFGNEDCGEGGICYHEYECQQLGGTSQGPCAQGFGICCTMEVHCGETTHKAVSVFVGGTAQGACSLTVEKMPCAKQIRLDFYNLELEQPVDGNCISERLLVTGQNVNSVVPILCGSNSGQHVHMDVDEVNGPFMVSVISPSKKYFRMKVAQLCESDPLLAPKGCLQYYTETTGVMSSFNYGQPPEPATYLNNLNYAMCLKKGREMCLVEYRNTVENGEEHIFDISNLDLDGDAIVPDGEAGAEVFNCPEDYLAIAGVRLCGQKFNDATTDADFTQNAPVLDKSTGPFIVSFTSSPSVVGRGFRLQYEQQPCNSG